MSKSEFLDDFPGLDLSFVPECLQVQCIDLIEQGDLRFLKCMNKCFWKEFLRDHAHELKVMESIAMLCFLYITGFRLHPDNDTQVFCLICNLL